MTQTQKIELKDRGGGITAESLDFFRRNRGVLGKIESVRCSFNGSGTIYNTVIVGITAIMHLSGLNCGYGGEGPHGLYTLLKELGLESRGFSETEIPHSRCVVR